MYNAEKIRIGIVGISGKLGRAIIEESQSWNHIEITVGIIRGNRVDYDRLVEEIHRTILNQVIITSQIKYLEQCDVIVDCSRKEVCLSYLNEYKLLNKPLVIAVTGFTQKELNIIEIGRAHV